jgi:hypothetical protein
MRREPVIRGCFQEVTRRGFALVVDDFEVVGGEVGGEGGEPAVCRGKGLVCGIGGEGGSVREVETDGGAVGLVAAEELVAIGVGG